MKAFRLLLLLAGGALCAASLAAARQEPEAATLPAGVRPVWSLEQADRQRTPTREEVSLNGLWRWQPAGERDEAVPAGGWGFYKVPGPWPGITDYMQKDSQTLYPHPSWRDKRLAGVTAAWYQRTLAIPPEWKGRRIALRLDTLNSLAVAYLDGARVGELRFPAGELDLTAACRPGAQHTLSLLVLALPLKGVLLSYTDSASAREVKGAVARRGLCGDAALVSTPAGARVEDLKVDPSVQRGEIGFDVGLAGLGEQERYALRAEIRGGGKRVATFASKPFRAGDLSGGRFRYAAAWKAPKLWDLHTPQNTYQTAVTLAAEDGRALDTSLPQRFGFREFRIEGRDFILNGTRLNLSVVPLDNAQVGAAASTYAAARETLERLKGIGINFVYTHHYDCLPGSHLSLAEILRAADDVGMLVAVTQPHFSHYEWQAADADRTNGYARHAEFTVREVQNHPSVVAYSMSHNATGYSEDMNPDMIDGVQDPRDQYAQRNARLALRAEAIVRALDPTRIVYHHAGGNIGALHSANFYPNWAPVQELSDWFEHWATKGVKPAYLCEYGAPFSWDWGMYRGWYNGQREFGSAPVPWEFCQAEWNAQFLGDSAYRISERERANILWEAAQFRAGKVWHRWDYPTPLGSSAFAERDPVYAEYLTDNWRAFRTWGVSAISPWEHGLYWRLRDGVDRGRKALAVDWDHLQHPGYSPDYLGERYEAIELAYERSDWVPTTAGEALLRNNRPLLAYVGGGPESFTSKDHNFLPGETVEKQLVVINNTREPVTAACRWSLSLRKPLTGSREVRVAPGDQARVALRFALPKTLPAGAYHLDASVHFSTGETQEDRFAVAALAPPPPAGVSARIALFDPKGDTAQLLAGLGVRCEPVEAGADLAPFSLLIVGRGALTRGGAAPDLARVANGLKVIVFEQTAEALEQRLGFRVAEYGLRRAYPRVPDHPLLAGVAAEQLRDWRGSATLQPPRLTYEMRPRYGPTVRWCGIPVTRVWRCGNRGNVASVLIEKPARGDFLPVVDGGYALQYSPLLEYREGRGVVLFCQLDVTGRTRSDPAAARIARNLLAYAAGWKPAPRREVVYAGDAAGRRYLESAGVPLAADNALNAGRLLVLGPGGGAALGGRAAQVRDWLAADGRALALGVDETDARDLLPAPVQLKRQEHLATFFATPAGDSPLAGVAPADVHCRDPRPLPLVTGGAEALGDGVLAQAAGGRVVFDQLAPWQFEAKQPMNVKRTFRRAACALSRLLGNMGASGSTPLLARFGNPVTAFETDGRWLSGLYLDTPEEWDDPYRFFRW